MRSDLRVRGPLSFVPHAGLKMEERSPVIQMVLDIYRTMIHGCETGLYFLIALLSDVNYCKQAAKQTSVLGWILDAGLLLWLILLETILTSHGMLCNLREYCGVYTERDAGAGQHLAGRVTEKEETTNKYADIYVKAYNQQQKTKTTHIQIILPFLLITLKAKVLQVFVFSLYV